LKLLFAKIAALYANPQFLIFLVVSGGAAGVNLLARLAFSLAFTYPAAVTLAYAVGMTVAFVLNLIFVFPGSTKSMSHKVLFFILVNAAAFPLVLAVSWVLGDLLLPRIINVALAETLGHAVGVMSPAFSSFALHKFFTFRSVEAQGAGGSFDG